MKKNKKHYDKYKKFDVVYADFGRNPHGVQGGIRPGIVVSCDASNHGGAPQISVVPLSSKLKDNPVHVIVEPSEIRGYALSKVGKGSLYFFQTVSRKACGIFYPVYFVAPVLAFIFIKQVIVIFSCPLVKFPFVLKRLCFSALIAAQLIPLALCQKIFSTNLAPPEAKPPVI